MSTKPITTRPRPSVSPDTPVVRRVDHVILRVDAASYDRVYRLFSTTLHLPTPWPITQHPAFRSGGIFAGNVDFEILYVPSRPALRGVQLYGLAFETQMQDFARLTTRGIPYIATPYMQQEADQTEPALLWTNVFLRDFLGSTPWMKTMFALRNLTPDNVWLAAISRGSAKKASGAEFLFNQIYRHGIVFLVKYNPGWRAVDAERRRSVADFIGRGGGTLGLVSVKEVVIGVTNLSVAVQRWGNLLRPAQELSTSAWQVGDGPAVRLIAARTDALHHLVWEVESLAAAWEVLQDLRLLGEVHDDEITLDKAALGGLDIRLVEA